MGNEFAAPPGAGGAHVTAGGSAPAGGTLATGGSAGSGSSAQGGSEALGEGGTSAGGATDGGVSGAASAGSSSGGGGATATGGQSAGGASASGGSAEGGSSSGGSSSGGSSSGGASGSGGSSSCVPRKACANAGMVVGNCIPCDMNHCGSYSDGCNGTVDCGTCPGSDNYCSNQHVCTSLNNGCSTYQGLYGNICVRYPSSLPAGETTVYCKNAPAGPACVYDSSTSCWGCTGA